MIRIERFVFNMFYENTFVISDETNECVIIDPGCYAEHERDKLSRFISRQGLKPVHLLNTHCHIDHIFGNRFVAETWNLKLTIPDGEQSVLEAFPKIAEMYAIPNIQQSPDPEIILFENDIVKFGNSSMKVISAPGHSPGGICFYFEEEKILIAGDVIFEDSIGRTDLPGGNHNLLIQNIKTKILTLPEEVQIYCGHGNSTTVGREKKYNQFLR
jgi:hydroxyacylglutathione hydrolase